MKLLFLISASLALSAPLVADGTVASRSLATPATDWNISGSEWTCNLNRTFLIEGQPLYFTISREPIQTLSWTRMANDIELKANDGKKATIWIDGVQQANDVHFNIKKAPQFMIREYMTDYHELGYNKTTRSIRYQTEEHGDVELAVGDFQVGWAKLEDCVNDMHTRLGIEEGQLERITTQPEGEPYKFFGHPGYNMDTALFYWVEEDGRVRECRVLVYDKKPEDSDKMCARMVKRGKFKPALDVDGKPVRAPQYQFLRSRVSVERY